MNIQRLNSHDHAKLRVRQDLSEYEKTIYSPIVLPEFRRLQSSYPIVLTKSSDGSAYQPVALFGLQAEENLFINDSVWESPHLPLLIERGPLLIGTASEDERNSTGENFVAININHKNVSSDEGQRLFHDDGSNTEYLDHLTDVLKLIHSGVQTTEDFVKQLSMHDLITPLTLRIPLAKGNAAEVTGLYAIDEEKLERVSQDTLIQLHRSSFLMASYMMIASLAQVSSLIDLKNRRLERVSVE